MKKMLIVLLILLFNNPDYLSQPVKDYLSIAVVRLDGILVPVARFEESKLIDLYSKVESYLGQDSLHLIDELIWEEYKIDSWKYYPFSGSQTELFVGDLVYYDPFSECPGIGFISSLSKRDVQPDTYPKEVTGIGANKNVEISFFKRSSDSIKTLLDRQIPYYTIDSATALDAFNFHQIKIKAGAKIKPIIKKLVESINDGKILYYYDAECIIGSSNEGKPIIIYTYGIIQKDKNYLFTENEKSFGGEKSSYTRPLAMIGYKKKMFSLEETIHYEGVEYHCKIIR